MKKTMRRLTKALMTAVIVLALFGSRVLVAFADTGTVKVNGVNVRPQPSVQGNALGMVNQGQTFEIEGTEKDATGMDWYKITYNGQTGYVRSDFMDVTPGDGGNQQGGAGTGDTTGTDPAQTVDTPERNATVNANNAIPVRNGAGQNYAQKAQLQPNEAVTVTGEATDANGALWYRIRYGDNQEGYVSGAFLSVEEPAPTTGPGTGTTPTSPVTTDPNAGNTDGLMGQQYTVVYDLDDQGNMAPYLMDNNAGSQISIQQLLADHAETIRLQGVERSNTILKIIAIILGVITVIAVALLLITMMRARRYNDDDYDDADDGEDDYEDEAPRRGLFGRKRDDDYDDEEDDEEYDDEEDDYDDGGRRRGGFFSRFKRRRDDDYDDEEDYDDEDEAEDEPPRAIRQVYSPERQSYDERQESARGRRSRNFIDEDADDFEYGFLDRDS